MLQRQTLAQVADSLTVVLETDPGGGSPHLWAQLHPHLAVVLPPPFNKGVNRSHIHLCPV